MLVVINTKIKRLVVINTKIKKVDRSKNEQNKDLI